MPNEIKNEMKLPFGKTAVLLGYVSEENLKEALIAQTTTHRGKPLGEIMVEMGFLTNEQIQTIVTRQSGKKMICPQCKRKYQIVAYQEGRNYICRDCPNKISLVMEKISVLPFKPKKVDLMGITQEFAAFSKDKIDFADEPEVSTKKIMQKIGFDSSIVDYSKRPKARKKFNYIKFVMILGIFTLIGFVGSNFLSKDNPKSNPNSSQSTGKTKGPTPEDIALEYEKIRSIVYEEWNRGTIESKITQYQNFISKYQDSPYTIKVREEIQSLEEKIRQIDERFQVEREIGLARPLIQEGSYSNAEGILQKTRPRIEKLNLVSLWNEVSKDCHTASKKTFEELIDRVKNDVEKKNYISAIEALGLAKNQQMRQYQQDLSELLEKITQEHLEYRWILVAHTIMLEIYPLLQRKNYQEALANLEKNSTNEYAHYVQLWGKQIRQIQTFWDKILSVVESAKKARINWKLEDGSKLQGNISKYNAKSDMAYVSSKGGLRNIVLGQVHIEEFAKICLSKDSDEDSKLAFTAMMITWKGAKNVWLPSSQNDPYTTFAIFYLVAHIHFSGMAQKIEQCSIALDMLNNQYNQHFAWKNLQIKVAESLWNSSRANKISKKNQQEFLLMLKKFFPNTEFGLNAEELLRKIK